MLLKNNYYSTITNTYKTNSLIRSMHHGGRYFWNV